MLIKRRFYFPAQTVAPVTPSFGTGWSVTAGVIRGLAVTSKRYSPYTSEVTNANGTVASILNMQFISQPLMPQVISGATRVSGQFIGSESNGGMDAVPAVAIRVVSNDGTTDRGYLFHTVWPTLAGNEYTTSLTNRFTPPPTGITGRVDVQNGDRLVFEIGARQGAVSANRTVTQRYGDNNIIDMPVNQTATIEQTPWMEFNQDILLQDPTQITNWEDSSPLG